MCDSGNNCENNDITISQLNKLQSVIENLEKKHHTRILRILYDSGAVLNETKSGIFVNLTILPKTTIDKLQEYLKYALQQEEYLQSFETQLNSYKLLLEPEIIK